MKLEDFLVPAGWTYPDKDATTPAEVLARESLIEARVAYELWRRGHDRTMASLHSQALRGTVTGAAVGKLYVWCSSLPEVELDHLDATRRFLTDATAAEHRWHPGTGGHVAWTLTGGTVLIVGDDGELPSVQLADSDELLTDDAPAHVADMVEAFIAGETSTLHVPDAVDNPAAVDPAARERHVALVADLRRPRLIAKIRRLDPTQLDRLSDFLDELVG